LLVLGIMSDLGLLLVFKYAAFLTGNLNGLLAAARLGPLPVPRLVLPLGISFFTFHKISYKVDVYRRAAQVRRGPLDLALYILLFPQLIAGPIVRYWEIANELVARKASAECFAIGARRFIIGLGKKMMLANTVGYTADQIFALPAGDLTTALAWLGTLCYTLQIYFDFSGYSDMAIGLARMFGFHFPENFNYPYISSSITEFWRRWHMSLSRWFRDYVYIPLGGNRGSSRRTYANLLTVFCLCGLWHGASWNFLFWGLYHGALLVFERVGFGALLARWPRPLRHAYTILMFTFGWALFRAADLPQALSFIKAMAGWAPGDGLVHGVGAYWNRELILTLCAGAIGSMPIYPWAVRRLKKLRARGGRPLRLLIGGSLEMSSFAWHGLILVYSTMLMAAQTYNPFIYFRF
jgi:alginate O-acetyltransferase complex protein AlgI